MASCSTSYDAAQREFYVHHYLDSIRLLAASDLRALFPGATVCAGAFPRMDQIADRVATWPTGKPGVP